jgi:hypothetical protein
MIYPRCMDILKCKKVHGHVNELICTSYMKYSYMMHENIAWISLDDNFNMKSENLTFHSDPFIEKHRL